MSLQRHIPELAIEWAQSEPERRWRIIEGSLCFADISGFTALAERLSLRGRSGGEELVETLSRIFAVMIQITHDHGGMLLKFGGDALLLFFDGDDHTRRAAGAAVEMRRALRRAAEIPTSVGPLRLSMSVGVHSGDVHFFLVGSAHKELVVLGPSASAVAAAESAANAGEILVSPGAAAALPAAAVKPRSDGELLLRWRRSPVASRPRARPVADKELIASLFPRRLGEYLAKTPEPEHRVACIAFIRFSGTDALLRERGPEALAEALDTTVSTIQAFLDAEGVTLLAIDIDRDGGKFFLGTGVPFAYEDDEGVMLRALRRIADASLPLPLQIGVNRGHVFATEVGAPDRAAYSAMGDTTNTAARITSKAPQGSIYAHPSVLDQCLTLFDVSPAGPFTFKGKKVPMVVYDVGQEIGSRRREGLETARFFGRLQEREIVSDAIASIGTGVGGVIRIIGDSGIGKSRLTRESIANSGIATTVVLRAEPYGASSPYRLCRDPLRKLIGVERGSQEQMANTLHAIVARAAPNVAPLTSLIAEALHVEVEPSETVRAIQPSFRGEQRAGALISLIEAVHPEPLLFVVDDAHWADEASADLLSRIARACRDRRWLMLIARRETEGGFTTEVGREIRLAPLDDGAMGALIESATEAAPLRAHDTAEIVRRAGGNPLFAMEILRTAREVGSLDAVPESLEAALAAQVDALDPSARRALRYATVLGRSFSRNVLQEIFGAVGSPEDLAAIDRLGEFLESDGNERYRFRNGLLRDTIYGGVAYRLRLQLHRVAGETMERLAADAASVADSLALHFSQADDSTRTWRYARIAAERARRSYANLDAARCYEMALVAARRLPDLDPRECVKVWTDLGDVRELAGLFDASFDAYRHALKIVDDDAVARADLLLGRARTKERAGAFSAALRDVTAGMKVIQQDQSPAAQKARARLSSFAAMVFFGQDRPKRAIRQATLAISQARTADDMPSLGRALIVLELAQLVLNGPGTGEHLQEALGIFEKLGDVRMQANVRNNLGSLHSLASRWEEAVQWLGSGRELYIRSGDVVGGAYSALNTAEILINQRRYDEAEPLVRDALRITRAAEFAEGVTAAEIQLGRLLVERGAWHDAETTLARVVEEFHRLGKFFYVLDATVVRADGRLRAGEPGIALALLDRAQALAGDNALLLQPKTAWVRGRALAALGELEKALTEIDAGIESAQRHQALYEEGLLLAVRAGLDDPAGDADRRSGEILTSLGVRGTPRLNGSA